MGIGLTLQEVRGWCVFLKGPGQLPCEETGKTKWTSLSCDFSRLWRCVNGFSKPAPKPADNFKYCFPPTSRWDSAEI